MEFDRNSIDWMPSYLKDRIQAVRDSNGGMSTWMNNLSGVSHGSVLGPLLYFIYVTDWGLLLRNCNHLFYADDLVIYRYCKLNDIVKYMNALNE